MDRQAAIDLLKAHEPELRALGVTGLSLFGSVARGQAGPDSDVDVVADLDDDTVRTLFDMGGINVRLAEMLGVAVDLVSEAGMRPALRVRVDRDRVHVF
jgi:hypothetical protein